jgi:hypothetical protein
MQNVCVVCWHDVCVPGWQLLRWSVDRGHAGGAVKKEVIFQCFDFCMCLYTFCSVRQACTWGVLCIKLHVNSSASANEQGTYTAIHKGWRNSSANKRNRNLLPHEQGGSAVIYFLKLTPAPSNAVLPTRNAQERIGLECDITFEHEPVRLFMISSFSLVISRQ